MEDGQGRVETVVVMNNGADNLLELARWWNDSWLCSAWRGRWPWWLRAGVRHVSIHQGAGQSEFIGEMGRKVESESKTM